MQPASESADDLRREHYNAAVAYSHRVHEELLILRVRPDRPLPPFKAGQYTSLGVGEWEDGPSGTGRPADTDGLLRGFFSVSSPLLDAASGALVEPDAENALEFYIAQDEAPLTRRLFALDQGARLWMADAAVGRYTLDGIDVNDDLLFISTGTGEAPHNRMLWDLLRHGHEGRIASVVCCRQRRDLAYREIHERLAAQHDKYTYVPLTTRDQPGERRHVQDLLLDGTLAEKTGIALDPASTRVYLCGNPAMIGHPREENGQLAYPSPVGVIEVLEKQFGFRADRGGQPGNIHFEKY